MTLNLVFTSRHAAYAAADFRITYGGGRYKDELSAQKIVPVVKYDWCALVTFCGLAKTSNGIDVGDWIVQQIKPNVPRDSIADFVGRLRNIERWISKIHGDARITISIVGFVRRRPFLVCLSNFQHIDGQEFKKIVPSLQKYELRPKVPEVRVFGDRRSVTDAEKSAMREVLSKFPSNLDVLADVNRTAATRSTLISERCVVGRLLPTGQGQVRPFGIDPESGYLPDFVLRGFPGKVIGFQPKVDEKGKPLKPGWVQMAFTTQRIMGGKRALMVVHEIHNGAEPILG